MWLHSVAKPGAGVHAREHGLARVQLAALQHHAQRLVVSEPEDVLHARPAVPALAFDRPDIGDLPASGGVEGRLRELDQVAPGAVAVAVRVCSRRRVLVVASPAAVPLAETLWSAATVVGCSVVS